SRNAQQRPLSLSRTAALRGRALFHGGSPILQVGNQLHDLAGADKLTLAMADIVLTTLNAKYIHSAFGLRYLLANLGDLRSRACLVEFDIQQRPLDVVEVL